MSADAVARLISNAEVTLGEIRRAVVHLPKPLRKSLYDVSSPEHKTAEGIFFEALIYEILLKEGEESSDVVSIAAKFGEAKYLTFDKYAPDGLWYSKDGGIRFKIDGRVVAEMDFLVLTADGVRVFGEVIVNPLHASSIGKEVAKKKELLEKLYGGTIEFVLVTASELSSSVVYDGASCIVSQGNLAYMNVHQGEVLSKKLSPAPSTKRVDGKKW